MTRPYPRRASPGRARRIALAVVLAGGFLAGTIGHPVAAPGGSQPVAAPGGPQPVAAPPPPPAAAEVATGICQCLADHDRRQIRCLSSVQECQSACGSSLYSFVPNAPSCPLTAQ